MADSAFQIQYRQEFVTGFEQHRSLLSQTVTTEAVIKGNQAVFQVVDSGGAAAVTRGINGMIPARADNLNQLTCTLTEWHDLARKTRFNIFASQGDQRRIMQMTSSGVINRKIDNDIITELDTGVTNTDMPPAGQHSTSGPSGEAPTPPDWLASQSLPTAKLRSGTKIVRVHPLRFGAIFFGPGHDNTCDRRFPPNNRFDSSTGRFGVLYAARTIDGAVIETILRSPQVRHVPFGPISLLALTELTLRRPLRLVAMHGPGLSRLGLTNAISTGPYPPCQAWTDYLRAHPDKPDGIAYHSRHDPKQICYAMFEPAEPLFDAADPTPFATMMPRICAILASHGKMLLTR